MIQSWAFNLYFHALTVLAAALGILLVQVPLPTPVLLRGLLHRYARAVRWGMRWIGGMVVEVRGHPPAQGPALLACKHHSEIDGFLQAAQFPGIAFVAMEELFRLPVIGTILHRLQMIRVDTNGGAQERSNLARDARRACDSGRIISIYPEGYLMAPGERERYRSGIYYLSRDLGLPVTPVATSVGLLWNRRDWRKKAGRAAVEYLPPIAAAGLDKETFMRRLEDAIEQASDRMIAEFSGRPYRPSQLVLRSRGQTEPTGDSASFA